MKPQIGVITLAVENLERALAFGHIVATRDEVDTLLAKGLQNTAYSQSVDGCHRRGIYRDEFRGSMNGLAGTGKWVLHHGHPDRGTMMLKGRRGHREVMTRDHYNGRNLCHWHERHRER